MEEITRIVTLRLTIVARLDANQKIISKETIENRLKNRLSECDDVHVLDVQDFISDKA